MSHMTVLAILVLTALSAVAAETAGSGKVVSGSATSTASAMPQCFEDEKDLAEIKRVQKANSKSAHKYDGYGRLFEKAAISDDEILQRLIYAEVVAGGCGEDSQKAVTPIAEVIVNRVKKRQGDIRSVVFARNQFASSLNIYSESAYKHFLCPRDKQLWDEVSRQANDIRSGKQEPEMPADAVHYYLFQHSTRFQPPGWTKTYSPAGQVGSESGLCVVAYRNPEWK
ncbi:MAG: cell wall hydrolase [Bdellovibrionaceae bacterium]|nr:cell wall hydrolase [Bdellovibrionales bacterium]MCB9083153.1 cell wall hydrolase [Pseudobdellovibrionaceae bacterium]